MNRKLSIDQSNYINGLIKNVLKGLLFTEGLITYDGLYLLACNGLLYNIPLNPIIADIADFAFNTIIPIDNEGNVEIVESALPYQLRDRLANLYNTFYAYNTTLVYHNENIREDPNFERIATSKATEGAELIFIDVSNREIPVGLTIYRNMFNLTKSDKVSLQIYNSENPTMDKKIYLANFNIFKSKLKTDIKLSFLFWG